MFKRIGALAMILAGSMAVFTPAVAQARDRDDYRQERREWRGHDRRDWNDYGRREWRRDERREWREHEWRERERHAERYYGPVYYDQFGRPCYR